MGYILTEQEKKEKRDYWELHVNKSSPRIRVLNGIHGCGIYMIKWDNNPNFYIGRSVNIRRRMSCHMSMLTRGFHESNRLLDTFIKYGIPKFEVLKYCQPEETIRYEQQFLNLFRASQFILNTVF